MEYAIRGLTVGVQRWDMQKQGIKGGRIYCLGANTGTNDDIIGLERIYPGIKYDQYPEIAKAVPVFSDIYLESVQGSRGKDVERFVDMKNKSFNKDELGNLFMPDPAAPRQTPAYYEPKLNKSVGLVISATRYNMQDDTDENRRITGASIVFLQPVKPGTRPDYAGFEIFEAKITYEFFETLKALQLPGEYEMAVSLTRRAGHKPALLVNGILGKNTLSPQRLSDIFGITSQHENKAV